jgi:hypothetical protein
MVCYFTKELGYMANGALDWIRQFVEVGQSFLGVLPGSRALRWPPSELSWRLCVFPW